MDRFRLRVALYDTWRATYKCDILVIVKFTAKRPSPINYARARPGNYFAITGVKLANIKMIG